MSQQKKGSFLVDKISNYMEKDILTLSKEEIEDEMALIGRSIDQSSKDVTAILAKSIAEAGRQRLKLARESIDSDKSNRVIEKKKNQLSPERAREIYKRVIFENKNLTLAARNEFELSDDDISDILDDFKSLGLLDDDAQ